MISGGLSSYKVTHHEHFQSLFQASIMKVNNGRELQNLYDTCKQHIRAKKLFDHFQLEVFPNTDMELKMDEVTRLEYVYSTDIQITHPEWELLRGMVHQFSSQMHEFLLYKLNGIFLPTLDHGFITS